MKKKEKSFGKLKVYLSFYFDLGTVNGLKLLLLGLMHSKVGHAMQHRYHQCPPNEDVIRIDKCKQYHGVDFPVVKDSRTGGICTCNMFAVNGPKHISDPGPVISRTSAKINYYLSQKH